MDPNSWPGLLQNTIGEKVILYLSQSHVKPIIGDYFRMGDIYIYSLFQQLRKWKNTKASVLSPKW